MIAAQNYLVPALRQETISSGLTGPLHGALDASYVILAAALVLGFTGLMEWVAIVAALALVLTAATNTFGTWVDKVTGGKHALWHSRFTIVVFSSALALEALGNTHALWAVTGLGIAAPAVIYALTERSDYAEKLAVLGISVWLIAWALST
jgi:hypothetical protein